MSLILIKGSRVLTMADYNEGESATAAPSNKVKKRRVK
jgi:hypothetical protein